MMQKKPVPKGLKVQPPPKKAPLVEPPPKPKDMTEEILTPFRNATNELEISYATNRLRTNIRRGKEGYTPEAVEKAAAKAPAVIAQAMLAAAKTPGVGIVTQRSVAEHRANRVVLKGDRHGERAILLSMYDCLIDILEAQS